MTHSTHSSAPVYEYVSKDYHDKSLNLGSLANRLHNMTRKESKSLQGKLNLFVGMKL